MGLNVSHEAFRAGYSAFNRFRAAVCKATGGHWYDEVSGSDFWLMGASFSKESHPGLYEFLVHSDCDGEISPQLAAACADEMEALLPAIDALDGGSIDHPDAPGARARQWIAGCREAAESGEPLEFF